MSRSRLCRAPSSLSIASVSKWSWSVICARAGPLSPRPSLSFSLPVLYAASAFPSVPLSLSLFLFLSILFTSLPFVSISFRRATVRDRVGIPISGFSSPVLARYTYTIVHTERERERVPQCGVVTSGERVKIIFYIQAAVPRDKPSSTDADTTDADTGQLSITK